MELGSLFSKFTSDLLMKQNFGQYLSAFASIAILRTHCFLLYLKNLILARELAVSEIKCADAVVIYGGTTGLFWQSRGCHKAVVKNIGTIPGSISGIRLPAAAHCEQPIEICFYGIIGRQIKKTIFINTVKVNLTGNYIAKSRLPAPAATIYSKSHLKSDFSTPAVAKILPRLKKGAFFHQELKFQISEMRFAFDPIETIKPKN